MKFPTHLLNTRELRLFKRLSSPRKIQDYLDTLPINFEEAGETCMSPRRVIVQGRAHCIEGAILAAAALWFHGERPVLLDLKTSAKDYDHVVTLFTRTEKKRRYWGAISHTNHAVLRYREPVYASVRELAMSYFHEYFMNNGVKTLRSYSDPFDLSGYDRSSWLVQDNELWDLATRLDESPHSSIASRAAIAGFRRAHPIEITAGKLTVIKPTR